MDQNEYMNERLMVAQGWYSNKSNVSKKWHNSLQIIQILSAASIPFLPSVIANGTSLNIATGGLGVLIAVVTGIAGLFKFDEKRVRYRSASEALKHERFLFLTQSGPYAGADAFALLVRRVEAMIAQEHSDWVEYNSASANDNNVQLTT